MGTEVRPNYPNEWSAMKAVGAKLGVKTPETVRTWVRKAEIDAGRRAGCHCGGGRGDQAVEGRERRAVPGE